MRAGKARTIAVLAGRAVRAAGMLAFLLAAGMAAGPRGAAWARRKLAAGSEGGSR